MTHTVWVITLACQISLFLVRSAISSQSIALVAKNQLETWLIKQKFVFHYQNRDENLLKYLRSFFGKLWTTQVFFLDSIKFSTVRSKKKFRISCSGLCSCSVLHSGHSQGIGPIPVKHSFNSTKKMDPSRWLMTHN